MPGSCIEPGKVALAHMDQRRVIAAFEVNVRLLADPVINDDADAVTGTQRRDCAALAITEHLLDLLLGREIDVLTQIRPNIR